MMQRFSRPLALLRLASLVSLAALTLHANAQQLTIGAYHLQTSTRVSAYQFDYTYTADIDNPGPPRQNVVGTVTSSSPSTLVIDATATFGSVPTTSAFTSTGTFTLRQDRRVAFNPASLSWTFTGSFALPAGTVTTTNNPQVALYTVNLPAPGSVTIDFGPTTAYGRQTSSQSTATAGPVSILVAGMLANTPYHLQAVASFTDGSTAADVDHTFTPGAPSAVPVLSATTTAGMTPQPGIEQLTIINGKLRGLVATDLQANVLWTYLLPFNGGTSIEGAKLLPNGHFILSIGQGNAFPLTNPTPTPNVPIVIREIDLAGNTIRQITTTDLSSRLQANGYNLNLLEFHHEVTPLPNGHTLVLANIFRPFTNLPGYPGTTNVLADVVIDLDQNFQPVWVWNEFDHLDVNRHPMGFPDLTHTNAIVYSPTDHNILVSIRSQNWVVKVDYRDGVGSGGILWRLGYQGDFTLGNGVDPTDWQYAQHFPSLFTPQSAGVFSLGLMDNGNDRVFPTGVNCNTAGQPPCQYTTIPVFQIDENAKTATLTFHQILPANLYSFFGGNTNLLKNGNIEYDLAGTSTTDSDIFEVTRTANPQTIWHLHATGNQAYRGYRLPSLYPGVQWQ